MTTTNFSTDQMVNIEMRCYENIRVNTCRCMQIWIWIRKYEHYSRYL